MIPCGAGLRANPIRPQTEASRRLVCLIRRCRQIAAQAVNTIVQGTAANLIKLAIVRLHDVLPAKVRMLMTAHDSVLLEVPESLVAETRQIVKAAMETLPAGFTVPLKVDLGTGRTWAECKEKA